MRTLLCVVLLTMAPLAAAGQAPPDPRILRVERWLKAVLHHRPGELDAAVEEISRLSHLELQGLALDVRVFAMLLREPNLTYFTVRVPPQRPASQIRFTTHQLDRLRILVCAATGAVRQRACVARKAPAALDAELLQLNERVAASRERGDGVNYVLRRGAMLHADAAMFSRVAPFEAAPPPGSGTPERISISIADGRSGSINLGMIHWDIGRALLDAVRPAGDPMVRLWFRATAAWMQARGYHESTDHLVHALRLFPNDAELLFLSGCEHESFARPMIQAAVRSVRLPPGFELSVQSADDELRDAEALFRRALAIDPGRTEARLRRGRVLLQRGLAGDAAGELRRAAAAADEDVLRYYAALFLGAAEEALGNYDTAAERYVAAAGLYPHAQSPHVALAALARRRGDLAAAMRALDRVFQLAEDFPDGDDPWWTYDFAPGRDAEALLDQLVRSFQEARP